MRKEKKLLSRLYNNSFYYLDTLKWYSILKPSIKDPQYIIAPFSRYGHTVVVYKRKFYLWGGRNDHPGACNRLFCFDPGMLNIR